MISTIALIWTVFWFVKAVITPNDVGMTSLLYGLFAAIGGFVLAVCMLILLLEHAV